MWMDHPTPNAASLVRILREWLEMGLAPKLMYGSDATSPSRLWLSAMNFREDLYIALKGMVDENLISEGQALSMAEQIMKGNAEAVYKL
jgi:predicted TIM-barrel fold metal-dependent hydrolase